MMNNIETISRALPQPVKTNKRLILFFGLWLLAGFETGIYAAVQMPTAQTSATSEALSINLKENLLSIEAKQVAWNVLIKTLAEKTQVTLHCAIPLPGTATVSIKEQPVQAALEQLFGPSADFAFRYAKEGSPVATMPKEVWVTGSFSGHSKPTNPLASSETKKNQTLEPEGYASDQEQKLVKELVTKARNDINPDVRIQAATSLVKNEIDDTATEQTLEAALKDKEPSVRQYAVQALANKEGEDATEQLRQALQDTDPDVRKIAVENVVLEDRGIALLKEALNNTDPLVQEIAAKRLEKAANN